MDYLGAIKDFLIIANEEALFRAFGKDSRHSSFDQPYFYPCAARLNNEPYSSQTVDYLYIQDMEDLLKTLKELE